MNHTNEETKPPTTVETIKTLQAQLKAAQGAHRAEQAHAARELERQAEEERRAREAALPKPPPLPADVEAFDRIMSSVAAWLTNAPRQPGAHDPELAPFTSSVSLWQRVRDRTTAAYHRAELERAARENEPEIYKLSSILRSPDDVMVVGVDAFAYSGGPWEREGQRPRAVRTPGPFGFVSRDEWNAGLRELHERSRAEFARRLRAELAFTYAHNEDLVDSMAEKLAPQWARAVDSEVGFALEGDDRWDLPTIARRLFGFDTRYPIGPQAQETAKRCTCPIARVRWATAAIERGASIPFLDTWMREERGLVRFGFDGVPSVDDAVAFWAAHDEAERSKADSTDAGMTE